jgi:tripartite-type tricarboxylate transporter receptor subunit TctC
MKLFFHSTPNRQRRAHRVLLLITSWLCLALPTLHARTTLDIIVATTPGSGPDIVARLLAEVLNADQYQVIVKNMPGVAGELAVRALLKAEPNRPTMLLTHNSVVTINPHVRQRAEHKLWQHTTPVLMVGRHRSNFLVTPDPTVGTLTALLRKKAQSGAPLRYASTGVGSLPHLLLEDLFARHGAVDRLHVPYKGASEAVQGMLVGDVDLLVSGTAVMQLVTNGRLHALAVLGDRPSALMPRVPPLTQEYRDLSFVPWFGLFAQAQVPAPLVQHVRSLLQLALKQPATQERLAPIGFDHVPLELATFVSEMEQEFNFFQSTARRLKLDQMP